MAKIDEDAIAKLKSLFQDNEKALGSNFSQLIDFFNDNKVTDNGDGTFTVGAITVDASKLYNLINNSSPNILPLDNEFTGKNTFDIAPINKANGKPYITADSVPPVDLSNYPTKDQLATKVTDNKDGTEQLNGVKVQPYNKLSDTIGGRNLLTGTDSHTVTGAMNSDYLSNETPDDLLTLFKGLEGKTVTVSVDYKYSGFIAGSSNNRLGWELEIHSDSKTPFSVWYYPKNASGSGRVSTTFVVPKNITSVIEGRGYNEFSGSGTGTLSHLKLEKGSVATDWTPAPEDLASKTDVTTAISTATANMVDSSKPTNFTAGLKSGGVDVATAADIKSVEASAWRRLDFGPDANLGGALLRSYIIYQIHADEKYLSFFYLGVSQSESKNFPDGTTLMDLSSIVKGISNIDFSAPAVEISDDFGQDADFKISGTKIITSTSNHKIYVEPRSTVSLYPLNHDDRRVYYTELI